MLEEDIHCKEKVAQYELGIAEHTHIALLAALSDTERAVRELIRRNDLTGEVGEWIEAYESEVKQVSDKRFIDVTGEERDIWSHSGGISHETQNAATCEEEW